MFLEALKPDLLWFSVVDSDMDAPSSVSAGLPRGIGAEKFFTLKQQRSPEGSMSNLQVQNVVMRYDAGICVVSEITFNIPEIGYDAFFASLYIYLISFLQMG